MHRFYSKNLQFTSKNVVLTDDKELHHMKNVLRLKKDDTIIVFNDEGQDALCVIRSIEKQSIDLAVKKISSSKKKIFPYLILACAIPKKSKFETIIEKCTELGVDEIIPLKTQRTEIVFSEKKRMFKKIERYKTVAVNAAKQSQRSSIPKIHPVMTLKSAIEYSKKLSSVLIMPSLRGKTTPLIKTLQNNATSKHFVFFVGPEGDFTKNEYIYAHQEGCIPVSLGDTILKVETAAITSISFTTLFFQS